ncbi:hypothetical protein OOZ63_06215 [Paucibacter sp. PLA-PC-4]|uniref:hypothetical protein n=1 Tax=Paucibacter sp. PLA-PC-4 TaxID=2993655 RepID=UPI0022492A8C|nr:hypothetical protein [Paucibacter sp. PLA-PC-4]MCX2861430.1 hypothetical protein [Paucibacter sp. PLA-PC-4]
MRATAPSLCLALLLLGLDPSSAADASAPQVIVGKVLENSRGCERDGACLLTVRVDASLWQVLYHPGEGERRCASSEVTAQGLRIQVGDLVRATGRPTLRAGQNLLDVCASSSDTLTVLVKPG